MHTRIGRFSICRKLVEYQPNTVCDVMGKCIVVRCELMYERDRFEYTAISPDFDEVEAWRITPEYDVIISDHGKHIEFKRKQAASDGAP